MEHVVHSSIMKHLEHHNTIRPTTWLPGFHETRSCETQLLVTSGVLLKLEVGIRKRAWQRAWRYPAYLWSEVSICCQKNPGGWYMPYTRVYPPIHHCWWPSMTLLKVLTNQAKLMQSSSTFLSHLIRYHIRTYYWKLGTTASKISLSAGLQTSSVSYASPWSLVIFCLHQWSPE